MSTLSKRAMLALPNISIWTARRYDRAVSNEVAKAHDAEPIAGRYNKTLINVKSPEYQKVVGIGGAARRWHEVHTLPWAQEGARILTISLFAEYQDQMDKFREQFNHAVEELVREYPRLMSEHKKVIGDMYKKSDYPTDAELRTKFGFRISIYPVPTAGDFRAELDAEDVEMIKGRLEGEVTDAVKQAEREKWDRLMRVVAKVVDRLQKPDTIFRDTLIQNLRDAIATLPKLALNDDPMFDEVLQEVKDKLADLDPQELRDPKLLTERKTAAQNAAAIVAKMSRYMPQASA